MARISVLLAATGGGAQRSTFATARGLAALGHSVTVVMPEAKGPFFSLLGEHIPVVDLRTRNPLAVITKLARHLSGYAPDIVLANQQQMNTALLLAAWLTASKAKQVLIQRNNLSAIVGLSRHPLMKVTPLLARVLWGRADQIVGVSQGVSDDLVQNIGLPAAKVMTIYNPVVTSDIGPKSQMAVAHKWFAERDAPVILGVGNLIPQKDFATLVGAVALVRQSRPVHLLILGEGQDREKIERLVRERGVEDDVELYGFCDNPYAFMSKADVFVLSSRFEGLSRVLVEALACGAPCVATDCPSGQPEILDQGRLGRIVPMADPQAMANAILDTLDNPGKRSDRVAQAARFSEEASTASYAALIDTLLTQAPQPDRV